MSSVEAVDDADDPKEAVVTLLLDGLVNAVNAEQVGLLVATSVLGPPPQGHSGRYAGWRRDERAHGNNPKLLQHQVSLQNRQRTS